MKDIPKIRYAQRSDIPEITALYNHYIINSTATFDLEPATPEDREEWFKHYEPGSRYLLIVAELRGSIAGYASSSKFREKAAYNSSVESSIYLHPEYIGSGIGSLLYEELFKQLSEIDVHRVYACITLPNPNSIALHRKFDFQDVGLFTEAGYKFGKFRDIQWMEKQL